MSKRRAWKWIAAVTLVVLLVIAMLAYITAPVMADTGPAVTEAAAVTGPGDPGQGNLVAAKQLWGLLVSVLVPFVTGLLVRKSYSKWTKTAVAFVLSAIVGAGTVYFAGEWGGGVLVIVLACFGSSYATFWLVVDKVPGLKAWLYKQFNRDPVVATQ